jgi:hypothetical protein
MWLRMVGKSPQYTHLMMPFATGKTWAEWVSVLNADNKAHHDVVPLVYHLMTQYKLELTWARTIAKQYLLH